MIKKLVTGTGNSMKNISKPNLLKIKIPLPALKEQKQIAEILSTSDKKLKVLRAKKRSIKYSKLVYYRSFSVERLGFRYER